MDLTAAAPALRKPGPGEVEICGLGIYQSVDLEGGRVHPTEVSDAAEVGNALIQSLASQSQPQARATALLLQATAPVWNGMRDATLQEPSTCDGPGAASAASAGSVAGLACRAEEFAATEPITQLVALAQASSDPAVFALAHGYCGSPGYRGIAACRTDLLASWARAEPGNMQPWLLLLDRARNSGDSNAAAEALHQISLASYQRAYAVATAPWLLRDVPADQRNAADLLRGHLAALIATHQFGMGAGADLGLVSACAPVALQDGNRRQQCLAIANTLVNNAENPTTAVLGAVVGKRAGWSDERYQGAVLPLKAVTQAYTKAELMGADEIQALSCDALAKESKRLRALDQLGERELMRRTVLATGKSLAQVVQEYQREEVARRPAAK
jgi:hypothetical protein